MNRDKLAAEVTQELDQLCLVAQHATELARVPVSERRPWHAAAGAKYAADLVKWPGESLQAALQGNESSRP